MSAMFRNLKSVLKRWDFIFIRRPEGDKSIVFHKAITRSFIEHTKTLEILLFCRYAEIRS